ncbi:MAG: phage tail length tape measure family protein [Glycocaulis sp.]
MSFTVSMVIDGDASRALQAMEAANRGAQGLQRGIAGLSESQNRARGATTSFTQSTAQMERSLRSSVSASAMLPPRIDAVAAATGRAVREQARLRPVTDAVTGATNRFASAMRNTASNVALMHGPLGGVASRFSNLATIFTRMLAPVAAITVAVTALTFAATAGIFAEYERQLLTVEQVIRATGGAAGRTTEDIDRMALQIARGTLASAREVRAAAAQVLTFRSITGDTFDRTLWLAQDLAAVGFGSIEQAAVQLAKALEDPVQGLAALRRVGVSFSAAQMELIRNFVETGRVAEAQAAILAQVEAQVGGSGAAAGAGLAGAFDALTGATSRWFELVGLHISDSIGLPSWLTAVADGIEAVNQRMGMSAVDRELQELEAERRLLQSRIEAAQARDDTLSRLTATPARERAIQDMIDREATVSARIIEIATERENQRAEIDRRAAQEQVASARELVEAVIGEIERKIEAGRRSAVENEVLSQLRKAGIDEYHEMSGVIADGVRRRHEEAAAIAAAAAEQEQANRAAETGRQRVTDLIASLNAELAVMQASDPVMRTMIGHRNTLASATDIQAQAVRDLVSALEAEQRAQAFSSEIDRLQFETSIQGLSEVERRIATAQRRLDVDPDSDRGRQLDEEIRQNYAAEQARRAREGAARSGARATRAETDAVSKLIHNLQAELDIMREADPVAQEMIRHREALAEATDIEREQVRSLIEELQREALEREAMQERMQFFRDLSMRAFDDLIIQGRSFQEVMAGVARMIARAALEAALFGTGPMAALLGGGGGGGGLLSMLFRGLFRRADGGPIPAYSEGGNMQVGGRAAGALTGIGGPREDNILFWGSAGEYMVNARSTAKYRSILEAINEDRLPAFASGGLVRPVTMPAGSGGRALDAPIIGAQTEVPVQRIELVLHVPEGVTVEQVGEIAAGVAVTIQQGTARAQQKALPGQLTSSQIRRG